MRQYFIYILGAIAVELTGSCFARNSSLKIASCEGVGQCFCNLDNGQKIDLTELGNYVRENTPEAALTAEGISVSYRTVGYDDILIGQSKW